MASRRTGGAASGEGGRTIAPAFSTALVVCGVLTLFLLSRPLSCVDAGPYTLGSAGEQPAFVSTQGLLVMAKGKRTFQPNNRRRAKTHGFRLRMRTRADRAIVSRRRRKGRTRLTA